MACLLAINQLINQSGYWISIPLSQKHVGRQDMTYNSSPKRNPLSTRPNGKRDILDIRASDVLARFREHACSNAEFRVRAWSSSGQRSVVSSQWSV